MKIALDFDSTLCNTVPLWIKKHKDIWPNRPMPQEKDFITYTLTDVFKFSEEDKRTLTNAVRTDKSLKYAAPCDNNFDLFLNLLMEEGHELVIISANPETIRHNMEYWLNKFGLNIPIILVDRGEDKINHEWDILVDDSPYVYESIKSTNRKLLLYNALWNKGLRDEPNIKRVYNFKDVYEAI